MKMRFILLMCLIFVKSICTQEVVRQTVHLCAGEIAYLKCNYGETVMITSVINKYIDSCPKRSNSFLNQREHCESKYDEDVKNLCNGKQLCDFRINILDNFNGLYGSNCNFKSNSAIINYICIPNYERSNSVYDICRRGSPSVIDGKLIQNGFIISPNYPQYYGNSRSCKLELKVPLNYRAVVYGLTMNIEPLSVITRRPKDFLLVDGSYKFFGSLKNFFVTNSTNSVNFQFESDFITTLSLSWPKGFLVYFTILPINKPTTTTATTTTTTTTSTITTTAAMSTEEMVVIKFPKLQSPQQSPLKNDHHLSDLKQIPQNDKSTLLTCIIVGLIGILVLLVVAILFLIRRKKIAAHRRHRQDASDGVYSLPEESSSANKIINRLIYGQQKLKKQPLDEQNDKIKEVDDKEALKKVIFINETLNKQADEFKFENIYSPNPLENSKSVVNNQQTVDINQKKETLCENEFEIYESINDIYNKDMPNQELSDYQIIYATPTNRMLTPEEKHQLQQQSFDESFNTSSANLLQKHNE